MTHVQDPSTTLDPLGLVFSFTRVSCTNTYPSEEERTSVSFLGYPYLSTSQGVNEAKASTSKNYDQKRPRKKKPSCRFKGER